MRSFHPNSGHIRRIAEAEDETVTQQTETTRAPTDAPTDVPTDGAQARLTEPAAAVVGLVPRNTDRPAPRQARAHAAEQPFRYPLEREFVEPDWTRLPGYRDVTAEQW